MGANYSPGTVVTVPGSLIPGVIVSEEIQAEDGPRYNVWTPESTLHHRLDRLSRPEAPKLVPGSSWTDFVISDVDNHAEMIEIRINPSLPREWVDARVYGKTRPFVEMAAGARRLWLEQAALKERSANWFKPGQIVVNRFEDPKPLARPATVIEQLVDGEVKLITSNGIATVQTDLLKLHSTSIEDLQGKQAQQYEAWKESFKDEVRLAAMEVATENGYREDMEATLTQIGIRPKVNRVRAVLHLTVEVSATVTQGTGMNRLNLGNGLNKDWWMNTLKFDDDGRDLQLKEDEDIEMSSVETNLVSADVVEIHDESYIEGED